MCEKITLGLKDGLMAEVKLKYGVLSITVKVNPNNQPEVNIGQGTGFMAYFIELQILALRESGMTDKQIGKELALSEATIGNYLYAVNRRNEYLVQELSSNLHHPGVTKLAHDLGLIDPVGLVGLSSLSPEKKSRKSWPGKNPIKGLIAGLSTRKGISQE